MTGRAARRRAEQADASDLALEIPRGLDLYVVLDEVRRRVAVDDDAFDRIYPQLVRERSSRFWTPVDVCLLYTSDAADE